MERISIIPWLPPLSSKPLSELLKFRRGLSAVRCSNDVEVNLKEKFEA